MWSSEKSEMFEAKIEVFWSENIECPSLENRDVYKARQARLYHLQSHLQSLLQGYF